MEDDLISFIANYLKQEKCSLHQNNEAKMIFLQKNLREAFACSECLAIDNQNKHNNAKSIKRSIDSIINFIRYNRMNSQIELTNILNELNTVRQQFSEFYSSFIGFMDDIQNRIKLQLDITNKYQIEYENEIQIISRSVHQYQQIKALSTFDMLRLQNETKTKNNLTSIIIGIISKESLLQNCNHENQSRIQTVMKETIQSLYTLLAEQNIQLNNLIDKEKNQLDTLSISRLTVSSTMKLTKKTFDFTNTPNQRPLETNCKWEFNKNYKHKTFNYLSKYELNIPYNPLDPSLNDTNSLRLAFISPFIQDQPIKYTRAITLQINSMINSTICIGICDFNQQDLQLSLADEQKQFIFFNSMGFVHTRELIQAKQILQSPNFSRGDIIKIILDPKTNYLQLFRNNINNQPFQIELSNNQQWNWKNMVFTIAAQGSGGGDIQILNLG